MVALPVYSGHGTLGLADACCELWLVNPPEDSHQIGDVGSRDKAAINNAMNHNHKLNCGLHLQSLPEMHCSGTCRWSGLGGLLS